jgi:hypothetical protein
LLKGCPSVIQEPIEWHFRLSTYSPISFVLMITCPLPRLCLHGHWYDSHY